MQTILTLHESDINSGATDLDPKDFTAREAARAVVVDEQGRVALLKVGKYNYHKLPGGGIEGDEDKLQALQRELLEEIGCTATVTAEIGQIIEYRDQYRLQQTSYCYLAQKFGEQQSLTLTEKELSEGFEMLWADSIEVAIALFKADQPADYGGSFIQRRDLKILETAKERREA
jgi:8-oxo-dGTP pyrophosphatase MutT (NUDIX family)